MRSKIFLVLFLIPFICFLLFNISFSQAKKTSEQVPGGASFELLNNKVSAIGGKYYIYSPSKPYNMFKISVMLNSVMFVYPDKPYATKSEAWQSMTRNGLVDLAEKNAIYVIMPIPVNGKSWSVKDYNLYCDIQDWLYGGKGEMLFMTKNKVRATSNQTYIIAEGSGSTYVNNILTRDDKAKRVSGILTIGGNMAKNLKPGLPVPAYLVNASDTAVQYYKNVNGTDTTVNGAYVNSKFLLKTVISEKGANNFNADLISSAWLKIFGHTARINLDGAPLLTPQIFVLNARPNYKELHITRVDHIKEALPDGTVTTWHDFVPDKILSKEQDKKVPLVITMHGMDGCPIDVAESTGWAAKAAEEGFIVVSPDYPAPNEIGEKIALSMIDYAIKTYSIDESRIYLTGFSMGGLTTALVGIKNASKFAAIAPMGFNAIAKLSKSQATDTASLVESIKDNVDLPFMMLIGQRDSVNVTKNEMGNPVISGGSMPGSVDLLKKMNELGLDDPDPDFSIHPYWGFPAKDSATVAYEDVHYNIGYLYKNDQALGKLVLVEEAGHTHVDYFATLAWDFFKQFSRATDGSIVMEPQGK